MNINVKLELNGPLFYYVKCVTIERNYTAPRRHGKAQFGSAGYLIAVNRLTLRVGNKSGEMVKP